MGAPIVLGPDVGKFGRLELGKLVFEGYGFVYVTRPVWQRALLTYQKWNMLIPSDCSEDCSPFRNVMRYRECRARMRSLYAGSVCVTAL